MIVQNEAGEDIEVFTAEERDAYANEIAEQKIGETKSDYEKRISEREEFFNQQSGNVSNLRKTLEDKNNKLSVAEKQMAEMLIKQEDSEKARLDYAFDLKIKEKANGNADIEKKIRENLSMVNIDAKTPEQIEAKINFAYGGVLQQNPDLLAVSRGFSGTGTVYPGGNKPPEKKENLADTERVQQVGKMYGFITEAPK